MDILILNLAAGIGMLGMWWLWRQHRRASLPVAQRLLSPFLVSKMLAASSGRQRTDVCTACGRRIDVGAVVYYRCIACNWELCADCEAATGEAHMDHRGHAFAKLRPMS